MRVSDLVKSFEDIASSPRGEASKVALLPKHHDVQSKQHDFDREEYLGSDDGRNEVDARETDVVSDVDGCADSSAMSDEDRIAMDRDKKVHQPPKEQVESVAERKVEGMVDIVAPNSSELTDEMSAEIRLPNGQEESPAVDQHHGESDNSLKSQCSELTDEIDYDNDLGDIAAYEIDKEVVKAQDQSHIENLEGSNHDSRGRSDAGDDSSVHDEATLSNSDAATDHHQLCVAQQCIKQDTLHHVTVAESRDTVHSTDQDAIHHDEIANERDELDTCDLSVEKVPSDEPLGASGPSPVLEKGVAPKLHNTVDNTIHVPNDDNCLSLASPESSNNKNTHELIKEMEQSMDERFRRLEKTCEQIPLIMEQLQRYANDAKHIHNTDFGLKSNDQTVPLEVTERSNITYQIDEILKTTSSESIENDVSIMTSFPELRAYVHRLESTSTNAIANVLLEENIKTDEQVLVDETPFDEAAVLDNGDPAPLFTSLPSSDLSHSKSTDLLSKEMELLTRGDENHGEHGNGSSSSSSSSASSQLVESNVNETSPIREIDSSTMDIERNGHSRPLGSVLSNCSSMMAIEVVKPDPSKALRQIVMFLDDQHANFDRICWGFVCGNQCEDG